jgi:hypothetical protein
MPPSPAALQAVHNFALQVGLAPQHAAMIMTIGQQNTMPFTGYPNQPPTPMSMPNYYSPQAGSYGYGLPMFAVQEKEG